MPWKEISPMTQKITFLELFLSEQYTVVDLADLFSISRKTAYKWIERYYKQGIEGLEEMSRQPLQSPKAISLEMETKILQIREKFPVWGARKLKKYLENQGLESLPSESTFNRILKKNGCISPENSAKRQKFIRFEHAKPNDLWQMDFKGFFKINNIRCNPLTILDDNSRFAICLESCHNQTETTVKQKLINTFRDYGLPSRMTMDNGAPWGSSGRNYTRLSVWLMRLGIIVSYSRPFHPQTQGKDERFHKTLKEELLTRKKFESLAHAQNEFNLWRRVYNFERPHEGINLERPSDRYLPSPRKYPEILPEIEYDKDEDVRKVHSRGFISFQGHDYYIGEAFANSYVAVRDGEGDLKEVFYNKQKVKIIDLKNDWVK